MSSFFRKRAATDPAAHAMNGGGRAVAAPAAEAAAPPPSPSRSLPPLPEVLVLGGFRTALFDANATAYGGRSGGPHDSGAEAVRVHGIGVGARAIDIVPSRRTDVLAPKGSRGSGGSGAPRRTTGAFF